MDAPPFFSIITAAYNTEDTIARAIESLDAQSCADWEHLIIDGASTDHTLREVNRFKDEKRSVISEPDKGIYDAMNKGIKAAKGRYLFFLNSDDHFRDNQVLQRVADSLRKNDLPDYWTGAVIKKYKNPNYDVLSNSELTNTNLKKGNPPPHQATFVQKKAFERFGSFSLDYKSAGDFEWHCRALKNQITYAYSPNTIVCNFTPGGTSSINPVGRFETKKIIRDYFGRSAEAGYYFREILMGTYAKRLLYTFGFKKLHAQLLKIKQGSTRL